MSYTAADYAAAIWSYNPRTLAAGTAGPPSNAAQQVAQAIWSYQTRTLTVAPDPPAAAPNPAETAWRLGEGGAVVSLRLARGFAGSWVGSLRNDGKPWPIPDGAALDAAVWRGDDEATLFSPAVETLDADAGLVRLSVAANRVATLDPGEYRVQVGATIDGARVLAYDGAIELAAAPGLIAAPKTYCSYDDVLQVCSQVSGLRPRDSGKAGRLDERALAREEMERRWNAMPGPRPGFTRRRVSTFDPVCGYERPDATLAPPTPDQVRAWLSADRLLIDEPIRRCSAALAAAVILERQAPTSGGQDYAAAAKALRDEFERTFPRLTVRFDAGSPPDGVADWEVGPGPTWILLSPVNP